VRPSSARRAPPKPKKAEFSSEETVSGSVSCLIPARYRPSLLAYFSIGTTSSHIYTYIQTLDNVQNSQAQGLNLRHGMTYVTSQQALQVITERTYV